MRFFSCDLSMNRPGVAVLDYDPETATLILVHSEALPLDKPKGKCHGQKLRELYDWLMAQMLQYKPNMFVRERAFSRYNKETQTLNKVVGVADLALWNLRDSVAPLDMAGWVFTDENRKFEEIPPVSIKKLVTGNARAGKAEVAKGVNQFVGTHEYKYDDESDAVAVTIAWLVKNERPIQKRVHIKQSEGA